MLTIKEMNHEIEKLQTVIDREEKKTIVGSLANQYKLYSQGRKACESAVELLQCINQLASSDEKQELYSCLILGIRTVRKVIEFPCLHNADRLLQYATKNSPLTTKQCKLVNAEKFKGTLNMIVGAVIAMTSVTLGALFFAIGGGVALVGGFFGMVMGSLQFSVGKEQYNSARTRIDNHTASPFNQHKNSVNPHRFLSRVTNLGTTAHKMALSIVRDKKDERDVLNHLIKVRVTC